MPIELSGLAFDKAIISELETKLTERGYQTDDFAFEKHTRVHPYGAVFGLGTEYNYTVAIADKKFSVPFSDDVQFARFFYDLCCSDIEHHTPIADRLDAIFAKVEHWLTAEI